MSGFGEFIKGTVSVTKFMSTAMGGFDTIALVDKAFGNGDIATLNSKLYERKAYNIFETGIIVTGLVAIENIRVRDIVISQNPDTMETAEKVVEAYVREDLKLIYLIVNGEEIITKNTPIFMLLSVDLLKPEN